MRLRQPRVHGQRAPRGLRRARQIAAPVQRQPELVLNARRAIVEREVGAVRRHGSGGVAPRHVDVALEFERLRGGGVERLGLRQVARARTSNCPSRQ